jgi:hypothetical protein
VNVIVGAYAAARPDWSSGQLVDFYTALGGIPGVAGLELPTAQLETFVREPELLRPLPDHWQYEITELPGTMAALTSSADLGLASTDASGRRSAVARVERVRTLVHALNERLGRPAVRSVTVVSAPTRAAADAPGPASRAFAESLADVCSRDWGGAVLAVEHCDAAVAGHAPAKGFLPLDAELDCVAAVSGHGVPVKVVINWARSVIERRDAATAVEHALQARERALLGGVVLSGCAAVESAWGEPWADTHVPPAGVQPAAGAGHSSLMTGERMAALLRAAGADAAVGLKLSVRPRDAAMTTRTDFVKAGIDALRRARSLADRT